VDSETSQSVVGLGEVLWDCFADDQRPGGAPANVAYHAAQHGHPGVVYSRVGRDPLGDALVEYLASKGVGTQTIQRDDAHPTGTVTVDASDPNDPRYVIHEDVAWDHLAITPQTEALMRSAGAVCFGTLAQRHPASRATIHRALDAAQGALRVYDVNLRQAWYAREWVEASLARADVVKLNRDEVGVLDGLLAIDAGDPVGFCQQVMDRYPVELVCVTRGDAGCLLVDAAGHVECPGVSVRVADAVGAGDAFCAAMIFARLAGWPLTQTARLANAAGAVVAGLDGAMPDVADRYAQLRDEIRQG
jgi:fructokinase